MPSISAKYDANNADASGDQYGFRKATLEDSPAIIELQNRLGKEEDFLVATPIDPFTGASLLRASLQTGGALGPSCVIVADYRGQIVGLILCRDHLHPFLRGMVQLALCVDKHHRRRGVGSSLLSKAIEWAEDAGIRRLQLAVIANNTAALATYRKMDFEIEGTLNSAAVIRGIPFDLHIMARQVLPRLRRGIRSAV